MTAAVSLAPGDGRWLGSEADSRARGGVIEPTVHRSVGGTIGRRVAHGIDLARTRLELLHGFELRHDDRSIELPLASQRVVAFLALQERPVQRIFVACNLFVEASEERANARLRTVLWRIGKRADGIVSATSTRLSLAAGVSVDLRESSDRARRVVSGASPLAADDLSTLTLSGELLPDWYDDWVLLERERFRQLRIHALEALCGKLAAERRFAEAADAGLAAIEVEPLRESAHRALIDAYLREGNACDAVRQYRLFRDLLARDLGLQPSPLLRELVGALPVG
jgi:DNA-binding SARP family transcriptional activator